VSSPGSVVAATSPPPALRKTPTSRQRRLALAIGCALLAFYGLTLGGHHYSPDGVLMFQSAKQLFFHGTLRLDPPVRWGENDIRVSFYAVGLTLAYLPAMAMLAPFARRIPQLTTIPYDPAQPYNPALYTNLPYLLSSWVNPLVTALTGVLVFRWARAVGLSDAWSVAAALSFGLASPAAAYARYDYAQPLAALALTGALLMPSSALSSSRLIVAGASLGAAILTRSELAIVAAWVVVWVVARTRRLGAGLTVAAPVAMAGGLTLWMNWLRYGSVLETGYPLKLLFGSSLSEPVVGITGLLIGPSHGLLVFFPMTWLAMLGLREFACRDRFLTTLWLVVLGLVLVFYACYGVWWGGWTWGPRFLLPVIPLLTVAATVWAAGLDGQGSRRRRMLFGALGVLGFVIVSNAVLIDFVAFYNSFPGTATDPGATASRFQVAASPLFSGWPLLDRLPPDLFWLRAWQLGGSARVTSLVAVLVLSGVLAWSLTTLRSLLGSARHPD
jgi:hypothetical protein